MADKKKKKGPATTIKDWWEKVKKPIGQTGTKSGHLNAQSQMDEFGNPRDKSTRKR